MIRVEGLTDDNAEDPILWEAYGERLVETGIEVRHVVMRASDRDRLIGACGEEWLEAHKARLTADIRAWEQGGVGGLH